MTDLPTWERNFMDLVRRFEIFFPDLVPAIPGDRLLRPDGWPHFRPFRWLP